MENKENETKENLLADKVPTASNNELQHQTNNQRFSSINLFDDKQLAVAENFLTKIMRSDKGGIKSVNDGLAILMRAQDLNLPFSTCIEHIHVINGKSGVDIHVIKALLSKAAITWELTKDYVAQYECTDGFNVYVDNLLPEYAIRCKTADEATKLAEADTNNEHIYVYPVNGIKILTVIFIVITNLLNIIKSLLIKNMLITLLLKRRFLLLVFLLSQ